MQNKISCCQNDQLFIRWDKTFCKIYKGPCLRLASYRSIDNNFLSVTALPSYPGNIKLVTYISQWNQSTRNPERQTNWTHSDWLQMTELVPSTLRAICGRGDWKYSHPGDETFPYISLRFDQRNSEHLSYACFQWWNFLRRFIE